MDPKYGEMCFTKSGINVERGDNNYVLIDLTDCAFFCVMHAWLTKN
jgi:hypothetical protein